MIMKEPIWHNIPKATVSCKRVSGHIRAHKGMRAGGYHYSLFHYFTSTYPVQFEHFLKTGC